MQATVAQPVERHLGKVEVPGSIPGGGSKMFKSKKEKEAIENYRKHASVALECMDLFINEVQALLDEKWDEMARLEKEIYEKERVGDALRRKNEYLFSEGLLFPADRMTFINLSEQIDKVIDKIQQVSRIIGLRKPSKEAIEFLKDSLIMEYLNITKQSVKTMCESAIALLENTHKAVEKAHEVEEYESKADELKLELLCKLYGEESSIDVLSILQLEKMILWIDAISDKAEDASDVIILITAKMHP
jgi:predicted phosphate transport protein (TIGR00153 family)